MVKKVSKFNDWLINQRFFRVGWLAKDARSTKPTAPAAPAELSDLPDDLAIALTDAVNDLPSPSLETQAVLEPLEKAIAQWIENPNGSNNSVVILAQPVTPVSLILGESLSQLDIQEKHQLDIRLVDWIQRPPRSSSIQEKLKKQLGINDQEDEKQNPNGAKQIAIVPNLCWCFLRSARGLSGIDYLQDSVMNNDAQFIVLGCGQIGWEYLKSTLKFHAYCDQVVHLPKLTGEQLQAWIEPIAKRFDIHFSDAALHKRLGDPNHLENIHISIEKPIETLSEITQEATATAKSSLRSVKEALEGDRDEDSEDTSPKREYFNRLADISDGVSIVAIQLFIQSLCYRNVAGPTQKDSDQNLRARKQSEKHELEKHELEKHELEGDRTARDSEDKGGNDKGSDARAQIIAQLPRLPPLPDLSQNDLYLLYSLMLHGDLTIHSLAESLGDTPQVVNNQVQILRNEGILEQKNGVIKTNPIHYPRLRKELSNNNFIVEVS